MTRSPGRGLISRIIDSSRLETSVLRRGCTEPTAVIVSASVADSTVTRVRPAAEGRLTGTLPGRLSRETLRPSRRRKATRAASATTTPRSVLSTPRMPRPGRDVGGRDMLLFRAIETGQDSTFGSMGRDRGWHALDIQVCTPAFGSTQTCRTIQPTINARIMSGSTVNCPPMRCWLRRFRIHLVRIHLFFSVPGTECSLCASSKPFSTNLETASAWA